MTTVRRPLASRAAGCPHAPVGDVYADLYLNEPSDANVVALFRHGTRVIQEVALLDDFAHPPWTLHCLQGYLDAPFVGHTYRSSPRRTESGLT